MIVTSLEKVETLPKPALGLLPAIHDIDIDDVQHVGDSFTFPELSASKGKVFKNISSDKTINIPPSGNWPAKGIYPGEFFGCDGRFFYPVFNKLGTVSYYPRTFERNLYSFAHDTLSFPVGSVAEIMRVVYLRLIANNTTAVWSVIFECGETITQLDPAISYNLTANITAGSKEVQVSSPLNNIGYLWKVEGEGIQNGLNYNTLVKSVNLTSGTIEITRAALETGQRTLKISRPTGPNIGEIEWLPPMLEQQVHITELLCRNAFGARLEKLSAVSDETNEAGFRGTVLAYGREWSPPIESMPKSSNFIFRMRLGHFDTENIPDPRGYLGYIVREVPKP